MCEYLRAWPRSVDEYKIVDISGSIGCGRQGHDETSLVGSHDCTLYWDAIEEQLADNGVWYDSSKLGMEMCEDENGQLGGSEPQEEEQGPVKRTLDSRSGNPTIARVESHRGSYCGFSLRDRMVLGTTSDMTVATSRPRRQYNIRSATTGHGWPETGKTPWSIRTNTQTGKCQAALNGIVASVLISTVIISRRSTGLAWHHQRKKQRGARRGAGTEGLTGQMSHIAALLLPLRRTSCKSCLNPFGQESSQPHAPLPSHLLPCTYEGRPPREKRTEQQPTYACNHIAVTGPAVILLRR
jgi:hypothetical protein